MPYTEHQEKLLLALMERAASLSHMCELFVDRKCRHFLSPQWANLPREEKLLQVSRALKELFTNISAQNTLLAPDNLHTASVCVFAAEYYRHENEQEMEELLLQKIKAIVEKLKAEE